MTNPLCYEVSFLRWRVASLMLLMLAENIIELTCLDSMKKIHSIMCEILLQISLQRRQLCNCGRVGGHDSLVFRAR